MTCIAAALPRASARSLRVPDPAGWRTVRRGAAISFGTLTATGGVVLSVTAGAAWVIAVGLGGAPHTARSPLELEKAALIKAYADVDRMVTASLGPTSGADTAVPAPVVAGGGKGDRLDANRRGRAPRQTAAVAAKSAKLHAVAPVSAPVFAAFDLFDPEPATTALAFADAGTAPQWPNRFAAIPMADVAAAEDAAISDNSAAANDAAVADRPAPTPARQRREAAASAAPHPVAGTPAKPALELASAAGSVPGVGSIESFLKRLLPQSHDTAPVLSGADGHTAVYDIEAHMVYMPDGTKLEAHSGLGSRMDDPHYVTEKARGPTPPNVYELTPREALFHGIQAIRLNPVNDSKMYGRDGILAHPYMLGASGQSFGCVSFKDYPEFLKAFQRGEVDRLVVVPHLDGGDPFGSQHAGRNDDDRWASK